MSEKKEMPTLRCLRCGSAWVPRELPVRRCARCGTVKWNLPLPAKSLGRPRKWKVGVVCDACGQRRPAKAGD